VLVYRVFPYDPTAGTQQPGHAEFSHRPNQGKGRLDNPRYYDTWYFTLTPEAAVGEVFGNLTVWGDDMFQIPSLPNALRSLGVLQLPDDLAILDLDDAKALLDRGLRPTQVISRNRSATQRWALDISDEAAGSGEPRWDGVRWWSFHRPHWTIFGMFVRPGAAAKHLLERVESLDVRHPAVRDAARTLGRTFVS
jgi:hypothetical protein